MAILKVDTISGIGTEGSVFEGDIEFTSQNFLTLPKGNTEERGRGSRGIFFRAQPIDFINIQSTSNASDFGDMTASQHANASFSSSTRGIAGGGNVAPAPNINTIMFVTIATTGDASDFGDLTLGRRNLSGLSNETRGLFMGGGSLSTPQSNIIDFVTIATTGDATDFGDLLTPTSSDATTFASPTRGIHVGGEGPSPLNNGMNVISFVTIASAGNATDFGDMSSVHSRGFPGASSSIRGIVYNGKRNPSGYTNNIDFITIATTGNSQDFGDSTVARTQGGATSNSQRGVFAGGYIPGTNTDEISFVNIQAQGNSIDFGNLTATDREFGACSDGHGGLN